MTCAREDDFRPGPTNNQISQDGYDTGDGDGEKHCCNHHSQICFCMCCGLSLCRLFLVAATAEREIICCAGCHGTMWYNHPVFPQCKR